MNVTFNSQSFTNKLYIRSIQGLGMPRTLDRAIQLANGSGAFYSSTDFDQRAITLECSLIPDESKTVYQKLDELKLLLSPYGGEKMLIFGAYPNRYIMARYSGQMDIEQLGMLQNFPITFMCSDPLFYEIALQTIGIPINTNINVTNGGSAPTSNTIVKLTMAAGQTIAIQNITTGKTLNLKNPDADIKQVYVDFKNANILDQALALNYNKLYLSGEFFDLNPGVNVIRVTAGSNVSMQFRSAWL